MDAAVTAHTPPALEEDDRQKRPCLGPPPPRQTHTPPQTEARSDKRQRASQLVNDFVGAVLPNDETVEEGSDLIPFVDMNPRSAKSISESRWAEINTWKEKDYVKDWKIDDAKATGARIFGARWVDADYKEKSRYVVKDFATKKDPEVFSPASDAAAVRAVEMVAVERDFDLFTFDVTSAFPHAWEQDLIFIWPPSEYIAVHGPCLWQCVRNIYGRRDGPKTWQEFFN